MDAEQLIQKSAQVENALQLMNTYAQDQELPRDLRREADEASRLIASIQQGLLRRGTFLRGFTEI